ARRNDFRLAGATAVEVGLHVGLGQFQPWRAAVHHHADAAAVGLAPGGDSEKVAKNVAHARRLRENRREVKSCRRFVRSDELREAQTAGIVFLRRGPAGRDRAASDRYVIGSTESRPTLFE